LSLAAGRQERELVAGRYRLAAFHRGDDSTEVWRALDESANQVVSLEFLRDRDPVNKERFLAAGRRMASVEQPSVMKVAAVHDDADGTFIVFEHLVHIPVPLEWLKLAVEAPAPAASAPATSTIATSSVDPIAALPPVPILTPASPAPAPAPEVASEKPTDRGLSLLLFALRSRELSLIDMALLEEAAVEFMAVARASFEDVRFDTSVLTDARAFLGRAADVSALASAPARLARAVGRLLSVRPHARISTPHVRMPAAHVPRPARVPTPRITPVAKIKPAAEPRAPRTPRAPSRLLGRVRWSRVLSRGLSLGVLAAVLIALPPELIGNVENIAGELSTTIGERLATISPAPTLERASFELPPLTAYAASFERQAPYPTVRPNGAVEWVVALRNTGSVGWYRGIDGAQASLALSDGTLAGVQTTAYVGPGQVGWFVVHFAAPSEPGTSKVSLRPRIDGRGPLPDLGIYAIVTVSPNP
jgi:hypothetical protein